ncbi:SseB family protein [Thermopolyspora sp. NPDC052614]|uniref:SseB family protein n=1 Tax=Thermopolyspora sp. NPDC052614 TaxID=3155682 RepID=UPI0034138EB4
MQSIPQPILPDDDGSADAALASALAAFAGGTGDAAAVVTALGDARLLLPAVVVPVEDLPGEVCGTSGSEMALPKLIGKDGRAAVPAFTSLDTLRRWRADARPIQVKAPQVCHTAVHEEAAAVVLDVAGPVPFPIEGALLHALAVVDAPSDDLLERMTKDMPDAVVARLETRRRRFPWSRR